MKMQGKGVSTGNIFLVTGIPTQTPGCPPSAFLSKLEVMEFYPIKMFEEGLASVMVAFKRRA
jgi:hypothetical protein